MAFDLDHAEAQDKLVRVHGRLMTVEQLREALVPKTRKIRQEAVAMRHLYDAIKCKDAEKVRYLYDRLQREMESHEITERLAFHMLLLPFHELMGKDYLK